MPIALTSAQIKALASAIQYARTGYKVAQIGYAGAKKAQSAYKGVKELTDSMSGMTLGKKPKNWLAGAPRKSQVKSRSMPASQQASDSRRNYKLKYLTTGYGGTKVKTAQADTTSVFRRNGVVKRYENGGIVTNAEAVYLSHTNAPSAEVLRMVCYALARHMFKRLGKSFGDWNDTMASGVGSNNNGINMYITYIKDIGATAQAGLQYDSTSQTATALPATYASIAENFFNSVRDSGLIVNPKSEAIKLTARIYDTSDTSEEFEKVEIDLKHIRLDFDLKSTLRVQNATVASEGTSTINLNVNDITRNPLVGKLYKSTKWRNYLRIRSPYNSLNNSTSSNALIVAPDPNSGFRNIDYTFSAPDTDFLKKPPLKAYHLGCNQDAKVKLGPGEIKYSNIRNTYNLSLNKFISYYQSGIGGAEPDDTCLSFGHVACFGLEKMLDNRTEENEVRLYWQIDNTFKIRAIQAGKPACNDIVTVV